MKDSINMNIHNKNMKVTENIDNIAAHVNAIIVRLNNKKFRRWTRVFDIGVLFKHASFMDKLKIAVKIALRCIGVKKYKLPYSSIIPTEYLNSNLNAINVSIDALKNGYVEMTSNKENRMEFSEEDAEQEFIQYKRARNEIYYLRTSDIGAPFVERLVSIVLPVYNGEDYLAQSIESVLSQTYGDFELIVVNDGSTDETSSIVEEYASKDSRICVINQENQKLPRALANGFNVARGEYFTWTSADNNMHSDFVEKLVADLEDNPEIDMVYANMNLIDENGDYITDLSWYLHPLYPQAVSYPHSTTRLNLGINNTIGAAFMYRASVAYAIGEYSANRYTVEDTDYWMRVNNLFEIRHATFEEPIYDYRWHSNSLTAKREELKITQHAKDLAVWDLFRRSFLLYPLKWILHGFDVNNALHIQFLNALVLAGHSLLEAGVDSSEPHSYCDAHIVYFDMNGLNSEKEPLDNHYIVQMNDEAVVGISPERHCFISEKSVETENGLGLYKGWYSFKDGKGMFTFIDIRAKMHFLKKMECVGVLPPVFYEWKACAQMNSEQESILNAFINERNLLIMKKAVKNKAVIIFPPNIDWNIPLFQRPQQLAAAYSRKPDIVAVYITYNGQYDDVEDIKRLNDQLWLVNADYFPIVSSAIEESAKNIIISFNWTRNKDYLDKIRVDYFIYEYIDELDIFAGYDEQMEEDHISLMKSADLTVCTATKLYEQAKSTASKTILSTNAGDYDFFVKTPEIPINETIKDKIEKYSCVLGYYGALAYWFDYDLIKRVAKEKPDWVWVLIGLNLDGTLDRSGILELSNVIYVPAQPYDKLPSFLTSFDIATIPFILNELILSTSPIKVFEYMAAGKPILTSRMPECLKYKSVNTYSYVNDFIREAEKIIEMSKEDEYWKMLRKDALENTWDTKTDEILSALISK